MTYYFSQQKKITNFVHHLISWYDGSNWFLLCWICYDDL